MKTKQIIKALRADGDPTRYLSTEAANRLEMLSAELKKLHGKLDTMKAVRNAAIADIQRCCATCAFCSRNNGTGEMCPYSFDCNQVDGDHWEWRGAKDINVPGKSATDTNVGDKEDTP